MSSLIHLCPDLQNTVDQLLQLIHQEPTLQTLDTTQARTSLGKAVSPTFQIVFAGAFSAGKSMLINALLERELLYSAEGHATGTECLIAYAEPQQERVVLTFLSEAEIREQVLILVNRLKLPAAIQLNDPSAVQTLQKQAQAIIQQEGGESKSELAKQASALNYLLAGFMHNRERIHTQNNNTFSMEQFNFANIQEAASFARRGINSAVLKRIEYYCHHDLLKDGNVLVDTPGIDAPVKKDADLAYQRIENPDTSAVICVLKAAASGELSTEETELLEKTRSNQGVRDRVFYVFNRIDETWYNTQLRLRLEQLMNDQFTGNLRIYRTSGLLGFYGSQVRRTSASDRFGLDSIFAESVKNTGGNEETPQFVYAFNNYCANSGKLLGKSFNVFVSGTDTPNNNYVRILQEHHQGLIEQLVTDSGVEEFRSGVTRYLTEEKRPLLMVNLADDLQPLCISLRKHYLEIWQNLEAQPNDIATMQEQDLRKLNHELKQAGDEFRHHIEQELNQAIASKENKTYESDFLKLSQRMVNRLDELLANFSVGDVYRNAQASHKRNSTVPILGILAEAFYYLANGLEETLVAASQETVNNFFNKLLEQVRQQPYYRDLYRMLGHDGGIEQRLGQVKQRALDAITTTAVNECDSYVRERPEFYTEDTVFIWQLRQAFQRACQQSDCQSLIDAEPAIRDLLKLDFERKVRGTIVFTYRQKVNQTLNSTLLDVLTSQAEAILQQYDHARQFLGKTLAKEAEKTLEANQRKQAELEEKIQAYNSSVNSINSCLELMGLDRKKLPLIAKTDLVLNPATAYVISPELPPLPNTDSVTVNS
ncbi:dynamin-like GTPase family protein [Thermosynechococcaceae cyanobacterium BACA0444]|uniref:Dynamin-like GTPase family protein n=1 Tax=Pseudocalidococcus azoricus BACA0444 TaxID=2918990 RepID=A0AAE4FRG0_9CYAN|nr:dynamin-like GTPase family protein [Pseudocalidococcus azoricus]MDS3860167.1 dynamin-like GTPase family protein [Pseudocalidococcus azoricus BACA0444]